jgi:hypothetical protein
MPRDAGRTTPTTRGSPAREMFATHLSSYAIDNALLVCLLGAAVNVFRVVHRTNPGHAVRRGHRATPDPETPKAAFGFPRRPSETFRKNVLNYRLFSTSSVAFGLPPRSLPKMDWTFLGRGDP